MKINAVLLFSLVILSCCTSKIDSKTYLSLQKNGNEITTKAQAVLLSNVGQAMQEGGVEYAIEFCNLNASEIIDSLNRLNNCIIKRVSVKNRNKNAELSSVQEKELWELFAGGRLRDTIILDKNKPVYYKPIRITMPACLKCHGTKEADISKTTLQRLQELYPNDLATGYKLNDFRGLWKVEFDREQ